jgi:predicted DNA-binding WGR domain protein
VRFGRIGMSGQSQAKSYPDATAPAMQAEKLIKQKTGKVYWEVK